MYITNNNCNNNHVNTYVCIIYRERDVHNTTTNDDDDDNDNDNDM